MQTEILIQNDNYSTLVAKLRDMVIAEPSEPSPKKAKYTDGEFLLLLPIL